MEVELKRLQLKNKLTSKSKTHQNLVEDDAPDIPTAVSPRRSLRLTLPQYNRSNSAIFVWNDAVCKMLAHAMEAPKE